ncbi:VCBS repeat-containing protein [Streptomyces sp. NBC_00876]|uniref:FG-GAP repeat domain-containing protein n=1 Tax=Streptomyces sp. NBC_00876 TaxID=2975853 RepID=UPI00386A9759|nr:VCBS repeat-containing protein [Streptomyces sp. NBC_00876]
MEPGRSVPARSKRARRIAACTALVLSAGMLLAAPASADDASPAPTGSAPQLTPEPSDKPASTPTQPAAATSRAVAAEGTAAVVPAKPRLDLDHDGLSDLMYRDLKGVLYAKLSKAGTYQFTIYDNDRKEVPKDIIAPGELDDSGMPVLLTLSATGTLALHQSQNINNAHLPAWSGTGWQRYNKVLSPGDLNGDGLGDLLARTPSGDLYTYRATGDVHTAPFKPGVKVGSGWGAYDQIVGLNDTNGDGFADVAARTANGNLYFFGGTGDLAKPFKARVKVGYGFDVYNQLVGVDDVNGDGRGDMLARMPNGDTYTYRQTGYSSFMRRQAGTFGWNKAVQFVASGGNPGYSKRELVAHSKAGYSWWYRSRNNGQFFGAETRSGDDPAPVGSYPSLQAYASSLTKDGRGHIVRIVSDELSVDGHFFGRGWKAYDTLTGPGDLSGDGKGDLLTRDTKGDLYLHRGNGLGTGFEPKVKVGYGWNTYDRIIGDGDLSGDGRADVVARDRKGDLYLYEGTGNTAAPFKARVRIGTGYGIYTLMAAPGDLDGDGDADLVAVDGSGDLYRYSSTGTGKVAKRIRIGYGWDTFRSLF